MPLPNTYQRGAAQASGDVEFNYQEDFGANRAVYSSQVGAADQIRTTETEVAKLRRAAAVIAAVADQQYLRKARVRNVRWN